MPKAISFVCVSAAVVTVGVLVVVTSVAVLSKGEDVLIPVTRAAAKLPPAVPLVKVSVMVAPEPTADALDLYHSSTAAGVPEAPRADTPKE